MKNIIKNFIKNILPKKIINIFYEYKYSTVKYFGPYSRWQDAEANSTGWSDKRILEKVKKNIIVSIKNPNIYERDGELLNDGQYPKKIVDFLNLNLAENDEIIDFGGSLGSLYFQIRSKLNIKKINWIIIEQNNFVNASKEIIKSDELFFFNDYLDLKNFNPSILILSSVLQYLKNPKEILKNLIENNNIKHIIVDRIVLSDSKTDKIYIQKNPRKYFKTSYPIRIFSGSELFKDYFLNFRLIHKSPSYIGKNFELDGNKLNYCNIILSRIDNN